VVGDACQEVVLSKLSHIFAAGLAAAGLIGLTAASALADTAQPVANSGGCFFASDWQGWKSPSPSVIYIRVRMHDVYRLDLVGNTPDLNWPDEHLVTKFRGSDTVCGPLDLELSLADDHGMREPLIVKTMTKLTPDEIAAIPPKFRP
jgi:hypothetical protein